MQFTVIVPHLNQHSKLARCLASLSTGRRSADEILVVDNGSSHLPREVCAAYSNVRLLHQPEAGPGPARNLGVASASGDVIAFIDADCIPDQQWLAAAESAMADPAVMIIGGDVRIACVDAERLTWLEAYESIYGYRMDRYIARQGFTGTGNLVVRRGVLDDVGPFAGLQVAEDRDWGRRATAKGYRIHYVPGVIVYHPARQDFKELCRKWDRQISHDFAEVSDTPSLQVRWIVKALAMAISPLAEIPRVALSDRVNGLRNRLLAYVGLVCIRVYRAGVMIAAVANGNVVEGSTRWNRGA